MRHEPRTTSRKGQAPGRALTGAEEQRIRKLHGQGAGRNEIARQTGRSYGVITKFCQEEGLSFDRREELAAATEIRQADLADLRTYLAHRLMVTAIATEEKLHEPALIYNFGGKENTYEEREVAEPPADAKRALMATIGIAVEKSLKLAPVQEDTDVNAPRSMLSTLGEAIAGIVREADSAGDGKG